MNKATKKISYLALTAAMVFAFPFFALAATDWASMNVEFNQGLQKDGDAVDASRSDASEALGAPDDNFVSLGYEGELILGFPVKGQGSLSVATYENTSGPYPLETADVYVSDDGVNWSFAGVASNEEGVGDGISEINVEDVCVKYVRLVDTTDPDLHNDNSDGYDVDAVSFTYDRECLEEEDGSDGNDTVRNENEAVVMNNVWVDVNTGRNSAEGSYGGAAGGGGDIYNKDDGDVEDSATGNGGTGGNASTGGTVVSGNIQVDLSQENWVNRNTTEIDRCACGGDEDGNIRVFNQNRAIVANSTGAMVNTGENWADGSYGGEGGEGGDIKNGSEGDVEDSTTGTGGAGGSSGEGGLIQTGSSNVITSLINRINENITRIRR